MAHTAHAAIKKTTKAERNDEAFFFMMSPHNLFSVYAKI